jgi:hypothetical protein
MNADGNKIYYQYTCCSLAKDDVFMKHPYKTTTIDYPKVIDGVPVSRPTRHPIASPTQRPSHLPTAKPSPRPTVKPPTPRPTAAISNYPTVRKTEEPTHVYGDVIGVVNQRYPVSRPTPRPTEKPIVSPTANPNGAPSPTADPTRMSYQSSYDAKDFCWKDSYGRGVGKFNVVSINYISDIH